jgi:hypothetical protein
VLDFAAVRAKEKTIGEIIAPVTKGDLAALTNEMCDTMLAAIADARDEDVVFVPSDPGANDHAASSSEEVDLAWTLGHVIVHFTAGSEENAFLAAEMARGVPNHGRSRYETPWKSISTIAQCRARIEESRRMRIATLATWPDEPHFDVVEEIGYLNSSFNAIGRFVRGLSHEDSHVEQVREITRQARAARGG